MENAQHEERFLYTYYWNARPNFGDQLTPVLINHFTESLAVWQQPDEARVLVVGSVLDLVPYRWTGVVAGAGQLHDHTRHDLSGAQVLALRGPLTAQRAELHHRASPPVLGDPGLLASEIFPSFPKSIQIGVLPHWSDNELYEREVQAAKRWKYDIPVLIPPSAPPQDVAASVSQCHRLITSSLHGMIFADSFNIPRRVERFPRIYAPSEGGEFKFRDYAASIGQEMEWGKMGAADPDRIQTLQHDLFEVMTQLEWIARVTA